MVRIIDPGDKFEDFFSKRKPDDPKFQAAIVGTDGAKTEKGTTLNKYNNEEVEIVLRLLAFNGGNYARTARQMQEEYSIEIHPQYIKKWATESFPHKYAEIQRTLSEELSDRVAGKVTDLAIRGADTQSRLLDQLDNELDQNERIPVRDLAPSLRNVAQATDMNIKAQQLLRDKPTSIVENRTVEEALEYLEKQDIFIDVESEEINESSQ
jgi:hypothetical protein